MRRAALGALGIVLLACSSSGGADVTPSGSPSAAASNRAADLRTQLDLLLAEHVMIVAKESAAAVNHSDQYSSYTALLTTNSNDLTNLLGRAFGNTAATQLAQAWGIQNGYLVDYAIGVVTHNDAKANGAMSGLVNGFVPQFAQLITDASQLPLDSVTQLMQQQMLEDKAFIDDVFAQRYPAFYKNLHTAYAQTSQLGDALAARTAKKYPDKFPGDPAAQEVDARVAMNLLLQEHSYVATMATDATIAGRTAEAGAAAPALQLNADRLASAFAMTMGGATSAGFWDMWMARTNALLSYAHGDAAARAALTETFASRFVSLTHVQRALITAQVDAALKVIDDQRSKSSKTVANDDRAAATAMQPIADSIQR